MVVLSFYSLRVVTYIFVSNNNINLILFPQISTVLNSESVDILFIGIYRDTKTAMHVNVWTMCRIQQEVLVRCVISITSILNLLKNSCLLHNWWVWRSTHMLSVERVKYVPALIRTLVRWEGRSVTHSLPLAIAYRDGTIFDTLPDLILY